MQQVIRLKQKTTTLPNHLQHGHFRSLVQVFRLTILKRISLGATQVQHLIKHLNLKSVCSMKVERVKQHLFFNGWWMEVIGTKNPMCHFQFLQALQLSHPFLLLQMLRQVNRKPIDCWCLLMVLKWIDTMSILLSSRRKPFVMVMLLPNKQKMVNLPSSCTLLQLYHSQHSFGCLSCIGR